MMPRESNFERTGRHRILTVDDSQDALEVVKLTLERALPVQVDTAASGEEALRLLAQADYDLILSDYHMPGMDGLELLQLVRARHPSTARVMITSATDFDLAVKAINEGEISAFFGKPLDAQTLVAKVRAALGARHDAIVKERGEAQAADHFRKEMSVGMGKDVPRPFTGSLGDSTRR